MKNNFNKTKISLLFEPILGEIPIFSALNRRIGLPKDRSDFTNIAKYISRIEKYNLKFDRKKNRKEEKFAVISITGSPGVGKSTVLNELIKTSLSEDKSVAALMLDPRSAISGGSFLGDRLRLSLDFPSNGVFIRSLSFSQSNSNDLAKIKSILNLFRYLKFDHIYFETIGTDQNNLNIKKLADIVVHIPNNLNEDWVQILKSDNLDLADIIFINKTDIQSTESANQVISIKNNLNSGMKNNVEIIEGSAINKVGITALYNKINNFLEV